MKTSYSRSRVAACVMGLFPLIAGAQVLTENFEGNTLDSRLSVSSVGSFIVAPGTQALTNFGSTRAFGFGRSTCGANCFSSFATLLKITFLTPTLVGAIQFKEMELLDNWGSNGLIEVDGVALTGAASDFGRLPYNDRVADSTFRTRSFTVNRSVSSIIIGVSDITNLSQIVLDDLVITAVPEPTTSTLLLLGIGALASRVYKSRRFSVSEDA